MKTGRMNVGMLLAVGILGLTTGGVFFGWGALSNNTAAAERGPASRPEKVIVPPYTGPALAADQTETVVVSGDGDFYLRGTGPNWTLVKAPEHGNLTIFNPGRTLCTPWTPGVTGTFDQKGVEQALRGERGAGYAHYYPTPGYVGPDSFTWHSSNPAGTSKDVVCSITVTPNHPPVASNQSVACAEGVVNKYIGLSYTHADSGSPDAYHKGQTMTFTLVTAPAHGTLKYYNGGKDGTPQGDYMAVPVGKPIPYYGWNYTPEAAYSGPDSFTWKCSDGLDDSATVTASITVAAKGAGPATQPVVAFKEGVYTGPGDIVPDAMAYYGVRGYSRAVAATGKQKAMHINRYSDGASMDVLIKPNGDLDAAAAAEFCAGTIARVDLWYDQSGHGNDLVGNLGYIGNCPLLTTMGCNKQTRGGTPYAEFTLDSMPCVEYQGDDRMFANTRFVGASPVGTFSTVARRRGGGFGGELMEMNVTNARAAGVTHLIFVVPGLNKAALMVGVGRVASAAATGITAGIDESDKTTFHSLQGVINGESSVLNADGTPTPGRLDPANVANSIYFGGGPGGGGFIGKMTEAGVWPTVFSADEQAAMYENQRNYWHLPAMAGVRRGTIAVNNARQSPPIDGTFAIRFWHSPSLLLGKVESTDIGSLQTTAHVLMDKQNLYVAWHCQEKDTDALVANATERDGDLRGDDRVELFLSPDGKKYYHFVVNPKGVFSDGKGDLNHKEDLAWNSSATVKASIDKGKTWTVTMSVPLSDLGGTSGNNQTWMLNINRTKPVKDSSGITTFIKSSWSSAGHSDYGDASGWGKLTGVNIP